jgi:hypothetical protein
VLKMKCACCGENTILGNVTERLVSYKCQACESSNTQLKKSITSRGESFTTVMKRLLNEKINSFLPPYSQSRGTIQSHALNPKVIS